MIAQHMREQIVEERRRRERFTEACYVGDRSWAPDEDERFRPDCQLALEDETGTASWVPVRNTLTEFSKSYDAFVQRIMERKRLRLPPQCARQD